MEGGLLFVLCRYVLGMPRYLIFMQTESTIRDDHLSHCSIYGLYVIYGGGLSICKILLVKKKKKTLYIIYRCELNS